MLAVRLAARHTGTLAQALMGAWGAGVARERDVLNSTAGTHEVCARRVFRQGDGRCERSVKVCEERL